MGFLRVKLTPPQWERIYKKNLADELENNAMKVLGEIGNTMFTDFQNTAKDFTHKPSFTKKGPIRRGSIAWVSVFTTDRNYVRLSEGTRAHMVGTRRQKMSFRPGYRRKTMPFPHSARSRPGGAFGARIVRQGPWRVSGIQPRLFEFVVASHAQALLETRLTELLGSLFD